MNISDQAVEAAARAGYEQQRAGEQPPWDRAHERNKEWMSGIARAALEAALPFLRAEFAEEVDRAIDEIVADINDTDRIRDRDLLIRIRAAIARNLGAK